MNEPLSPGYRATALGMAVNTGLAAVKLVCGVAGHSSALVADAIESFGDIFSSAVVRAGLVVASRPADWNHPYGHGKAEPLAALAVAAMLLASAVTIAIVAVHEIATPHQTPEPYTLGVLLVVIVLKEGMHRYAMNVGRRIHSSALKMDAWHHRSDALTSAAAAIGIIVALVGGPGYEPADDYAALLACVVIVINSIRFARPAVEELMDANAAPTLFDSICLTAQKINGVCLVEKVLVRKVGPRYFVDLHIEVGPELTVRKGHEIAHAVKDAIIENSPEVEDVLIHVEPHGQD